MAENKVVMSGLEKIKIQLRKESAAIKNRTMRGLIRGAILVVRDMDKTPPKIPVNTGNLRGSRYIITSTGKLAMGHTPSVQGKAIKSGRSGGSVQTVSNTINPIINHTKPGSLEVEIGFTANYAVNVHEGAVGRGVKSGRSGGSVTTIKFKRPGAGPKFLEAALIRNRKAILDLIVQEATEK